MTAVQKQLNKDIIIINNNNDDVFFFRAPACIIVSFR